MEGLSSDNILYNIEKPIFYENRAYCTTHYPVLCYMQNDICKEIKDRKKKIGIKWDKGMAPGNIGLK